jgi:hypothetical protein
MITQKMVNQLMLNPMMKLKPNQKQGGRRGKLKRQNSRLAWDSRISAPSIKLDLILECHGLPKKDTFSQADAFCCVWEVPPGYRTEGKAVSKLPARQEKEIGRTEVVRENNNPKFKATFRLEYRFNIEQTYVARVYDEDLRYATDLKEHDFIGGYVFTLGELLGANGCSIGRPLEKGKAFLVLTGSEILETREVLEFRFSGQGLGLLERKNKMQDVLKQIDKVHLAKNALKQIDKVNVAKTMMDQIDHFDPYFTLEKLNSEDQTWKVMWKSEVIKDSQNPTWNVARLPLQLLCNDGPSNALKISIWDWNRFTPDELAGFVETSISELVQKAKRGIPVFDVMFEKRKIFGGTKLKKAGILKALKGNIVEVPSMMQFISGGCAMDLIFAIDCTLSKNGSDLKDESNLHFHTSTWLNDYQAALLKISNIYDSFDGANGFTLWGYGAEINGVHQPYFTMGENLESADAIVQTYDMTFADDNPYFTLGKRADMKHLIQAAQYRAIRSNQERQCYTTLVVLSTGEIHDLQSTIDAVCASAEDAPLSIVIIGVGTGSFKNMERLMGDEFGKLRHSNGVPMARDIVKFVAFNDYHGSASRCAAAALRDVPEQFVQHFVNAGVKPNPPKAIPDFARKQMVSKGSGKGKSSRRSPSS